MRSNRIALLCAGGVCACATTSASGMFLNFEDIASTTGVFPFAYGTSIVTDGMTIDFSKTGGGPDGGAEADNGIITLGTTNFAGMTGNALSLKNTNAAFSLGAGMTLVELFLGDYGKNATLIVNGATFQSDDFNTLPATLGGATITYTDLGATPDATGLFGHISISGTISTLSVGGKELWIDDLSFTVIPTPGAISLLAIGGLLATRRRR